MIVYEFYWRDPLKGNQLIGTLPERRRDRRRITNESIMSWGKKTIGENIDFDNLFFYQVTIDKETGDILRFGN
jgi:hypothetical protein